MNQTRSAAYVLVLSLACCAALPGQTPDWQWQNPLPQGNNLNAVVSPDIYTVYAAGTAGAFLRTTDRGASWEVSQIGSTDINVLGLHFKSVTRGWAVGSDGSIYLTEDGGETWQKRNSPFTNGNLYAAESVGPSTEYIVGDSGVILRSTDDGFQWLRVPIGTNRALRDITFPTTATGYAVGDGDVILKTTDGGSSWFGVPDTILGRNFSSVAFATPDTGWVGGSGGTVIATEDGGASWHMQFTNVPTVVSRIDFLNAQTGYALAGRYVLSTTNSGVTWVARFIDSVNTLRGLVFPTFNQGWIVGDNGEIKQSTDNGDSWDRAEPNVTYDLYDNFFLDDQRGWCVGAHGTVLRTVDRGASWVRYATPVDRGLRSAYFNSVTDGWAVGDGGTVLRTTDGFNYIQVSLGTTEELSTVYFKGPSAGWILGSKGTVMRSTDGGSSWSAVPVGDTLHYFTSVFFADDSLGWMLGNYGDLNELTTIYRTTNGGSSWDSVAMDTRGLFSMWFFDRDTGWAVGRFHRVIKTTDGGLTWAPQETPSKGQTHYIDIRFVDAFRGWIVGGLGSILRTLDGGETWYEVDSRTDRILYGVVFSDSLTGWVAGSNGAIIHTVNGGGDQPPPPPPPPPTGEPTGNRVSQNIPNPFNPAMDGKTGFPFHLNQRSPVTVQIFDDLGKFVTEIVGGTYDPGSYDETYFQWDGKDFRGREVASGVYFYRVITTEYIETQNMVLVR